MGNVETIFSKILYIGYLSCPGYFPYSFQVWTLFFCISLLLILEMCLLLGHEFLILKNTSCLYMGYISGPDNFYYNIS